MEQLRKADGIAARCLEFSVLTACRTQESMLSTWGEFDLAYNRAEFNEDRRTLLEAWAKLLKRPRASSVVPLKSAALNS
jgi:hypothetical protein